ncbi:hypothetical protein FXO37_06630 [Capsicum annuum]|nr:hypothetical protein FXO37_06630 [Capsicum annuum]
MTVSGMVHHKLDGLSDRLSHVGQDEAILPQRQWSQQRSVEFLTVVILAIALGLENGVTALVATVRATMMFMVLLVAVGGVRIIGVGILGVVVVGSSGINGGVSISGGVGIGGVNGVGDGIRVGVGIGIGNMEDLIQFHPTNGPFLAKMDNLLEVIKIELLLDLITSKI